MERLREIYKIGVGPSSSHTMGPQIAAERFKNEFPDLESVECILYGSLALTGVGHLTDQIIIDTIAPLPINVTFKMTEALPKHENGMKLIGTLKNGETVTWTIYSIGGGNITIDEVPEEVNFEKEVYPHNTMNAIRKYCLENEITLLDYVNRYDADASVHLVDVWNVMQNAIKAGLEDEGTIPGKLQVKKRAKMLAKLENNNDPELKISSYAYAVNEQNASGGIIVTAPTCGACGTLPAALRYMKETIDCTDEQIIDSLKIAGLIGTIVKTNASISGAEAGCQAEVGTATSMAAAAITFLAGGNDQQIEAAAEIGMEHQLGLTCDPVLGYVQIPCIQRNAVGALKARIAAKLALEMAEHELVDFDTLVNVMYETGKDLSSKYRETAEGGLAKHYVAKSRQENNDSKA